MESELYRLLDALPLHLGACAFPGVVFHPTNPLNVSRRISALLERFTPLSPSKMHFVIGSSFNTTATDEIPEKRQHVK
jgi:hypothetical protein